MNAARRVAMSMLIVMVFMSAGASMLWSQTQTQAPDANADNTKVNTRDRDKDSPTADQQKENRSDRDLTKQIRQSIVKDDSLSTYAHNVKIVTQNGQVTLKGPVRSEDEKRTIEAKATEVAGENKVTNQLNVKPQQ
jgi:hyperosmotically inducible periplasmic protein